MDGGTIVLVVDDEEQIRRVLLAVLVDAGYAVVEAKDGQEAVEMPMRQRPNLVLLDVNLPDMNGLELCRRMRVSFEGPIVMLTLRSAERDKVDAFDSGANDYVVKPFATGELLTPGASSKCVEDLRCRRIVPRSPDF